MSASSELESHPSCFMLRDRRSNAGPVNLPVSALVLRLFLWSGLQQRRSRSTPWGGLIPG
jgi:hypothetical protein